MEDLLTQSRKSTGNTINVIIIVLLILSNFWFFYKIQLLEKQIEVIQSDIVVLDSGLDYVTPLAENGNRWAHSHNW